MQELTKLGFGTKAVTYLENRAIDLFSMMSNCLWFCFNKAQIAGGTVG